jgi:sorbitol-6-phosphate 2-dehydrogenase
MNRTLENQIAIVTGGAQGLGQAISLRLAKEGCHVVVADMKEDEAKATAAEITKTTDRRAFAIKTDVTQEAQVKALFDRAVETFKQVDIVVANAGILIAEPITEADAEKWRAVMNVNLFGNFLTMKHACRVMKHRRRGVIVQINSKSGKKGSAANSAYAASKFGGIGLVQSVALEMAPHGIRCNAICPGNMLDSPLWTDPVNGLLLQYLRAGKVGGAKTIEDVRQAYINQVPMKKGCTYDDVCNALVFLASDAAAYVTGIALSVTGGQEMN